MRNVLSSSFYRSTERSSNLTKVTEPEEVDGSKSQAEAMLPKSHRHAWTSLIPPLWFSCQAVWKYSIWVVVAGLTWSYWPRSWVSPQCVLQLKTIGSCLHWRPHMKQRPDCLPLFSLHFRRRFCTKFLTYPAKGRSELWDTLVYKYWWLSLLVQCSPASKLHHGAFQQRLVGIHNVRSLPAWEALKGGKKKCSPEVDWPTWTGYTSLPEIEEKVWIPASYWLKIAFTDSVATPFAEPNAKQNCGTLCSKIMKSFKTVTAQL